MGWAEQIALMTPEQMLERYTSLSDEQARLTRAINRATDTLGNLKGNERGVQSAINALKQAYQAVTGQPIRRVCDMETIHGAQNAIKSLIAVICEPENLPLDHPLVIQRLAEFRDAVHSRREVKSARREATEADQ